ncbi:uncharacterized protein F5891DRAFT_981578 [Suillus fuscotomentosus]|uniref:Uncharacterized protein n=1 Tax=Suillus fuscotomentosus TaxID=1912939 RepID=A0AAD4HIA4_9AGAM|nr:uncharacterized protein F5891DRAFT_981578 [Suillus fuscotomentosus]KAG1898665.1 hypothetical protein F5891DRAFT_981578 [Suillus fuscotomentosus]
MTPQAMPYCAHHNCTWIKDMLAHVQIHRVSEFSTSGSGDDVSVVPKNEEKRFHTSRARRGGENHKTHWKVWKDVHKTIMKKDSDIVQPDEQKEDENITAGAGCVGGDAIEAQASQTTGMSTRQIRKRKINDVNGNHGSDTDENVLFPNPVPTVVKRICRERTGTDWQTVLDIVKYGEEQQMSRKG